MCRPGEKRALIVFPSSLPSYSVSVERKGRLIYHLSLRFCDIFVSNLTPSPHCLYLVILFYFALLWGFFLFLFFSVSERKKIKGSAGLVAIHNFSLHSNSSKGIEHLGFHLFSCFPSIENVLGWLWPCQLDRRNITDSTFLNKVW